MVRTSRPAPAGRPEHGRDRPPRRLGEADLHVLQPGVARPSVRRGRRGDGLRQGPPLPGRPARWRTPSSTRSVTRPAGSCRSTRSRGRPTSAPSSWPSTSQKRSSGRGSSPSRCRPAFSASSGLIGRTAAFRSIHAPEEMADRARARTRLAFDELLRLQLLLVKRKRDFASLASGIAHDISPGGLVSKFVDELPFELTAAQRAAIETIAADLALAHPMHRLLQGDVGAGKTVVALATLLYGIQSGHQGAFMVPTEVLAEQHHLSARQAARRPVGARPGPARRRAAADGGSPHEPHERRRAEPHPRPSSMRGSSISSSGRTPFSPKTSPSASLGVVVVDEQHRFGVEQRAALREKGGVDPDLLVMTATPIPRTAAMTVYGDLDHTTLDELPPGRTPVATRWLGFESAKTCLGARRRRARGGPPGLRRLPARRRRRRRGGGAGRRRGRDGPRRELDDGPDAEDGEDSTRATTARTPTRAAATARGCFPAREPRPPSDVLADDRAPPSARRRRGAGAPGGRGARRLEGRPAPRPAAFEGEGRRDGRVPPGPDRRARRDDGRGGGRRRGERHGDGHRGCRPLRHRPAPSAARPGRPGRGRLDVLPARRSRHRARRRSGSRRSPGRRTASSWRRRTSTCGAGGPCSAPARRAAPT